MGKAVRRLAAGAGALLVLSACSSSTESNSSSPSSPSGSATASQQLRASAPGVSKTTITIGFITDETGVGGSQMANQVPAAQARIDEQNAEGGIDGRKLKLIVVDDTSTPAGNALASERLMAEGVFGVVDESIFTAAGGYKAFQKAGIPVTGGGWDGPEWGLQPNTNMFSTTSPWDPHQPAYTTIPIFMKGLGATAVAGLGYGDSPSSKAAATGFVAAAKSAGLKDALLDSSIPVGSVDATTIGLSLKNSGADAMYMSMDANTNFAIVTAAKQNGVPMKVAVSATGYGQPLLDQPTALSAAEGGYFTAPGVPVELNTPATRNFQAALAKYAHFTGVPDFAWYNGWVGTDLMIKGLEVAGPNPTRSSFITNLHTVTNYDAGGLTAPADLTLAHFGTAPQKQCAWFVQLRGNTFAPVPADGGPTCGTLVPNSNQL
jgi:branched-chain amino acid transport system substrate-binding protein